MLKKLKKFFVEKPKLNCAALILIILAYLLFFFVPEAKALFLKVKEGVQLKVKIVKTERDWANIATFKEEISQLNEKIKYYKRRLRSEKEIPAILEYLSDAAKELGVTLTEIKPLHLQKDKTAAVLVYYRAPILLKAECGYHQLGRFLDKLESADRFMKINNIKVIGNYSKRGTHYAELIVMTYVMKK